MQSTRMGVVAAVAVSLTVCGMASAQRGPGFGFGRGGGAQLLNRPEVQADLKLTDTQKTQINELLQSLRGGPGNRPQDNVSPEERRRLAMERQAETMKRVNAILNTEQQKRFKEITLQQQGVAALAQPAIAGEMKLTEDQKSRIQTILQEQFTAQRNLFQDGGGDRNAMMEKMRALRQESDAKVLALLTDEQKARWQAMLGTPLPLQPGRGGR